MIPGPQPSSLIGAGSASTCSHSPGPMHRTERPFQLTFCGTATPTGLRGSSICTRAENRGVLPFPIILLVVFSLQITHTHHSSNKTLAADGCFCLDLSLSSK